MMKRSIRQQLEKFARADLKIARKQESLLITDTQKGVVELIYNHDQTYTVYAVGSYRDGRFVEPCTLITGKASEIVNYIVENIYITKE